MLAAGWANGELQCFTNSTNNARVVPDPANPSNGLLLIEARVARNSVCRNLRSPNSRRNFTSAKIVSNNKRFFKWSGTPAASKPLIVSARIKVPKINLAWAAFWMLPQTNYDWCSGCGAYGGWCTSGEIDIMEAINAERWHWGTIHYGGNKTINWKNCQRKQGELPPDVRMIAWQAAVPRPGASSCMHGIPPPEVPQCIQRAALRQDSTPQWRSGGPNHHPVLPSCCAFPAGGKDLGSVYSAADWHVYTLHWDSKYIRMWVDSILILDVSSSNWYSATVSKTVNGQAPFDQPFYMLLNLAVGGTWPGVIAADLVTPSTVMTRMVDYIRVYDGGLHQGL